MHKNVITYHCFRNVEDKDRRLENGVDCVNTTAQAQQAWNKEQHNREYEKFVASVNSKHICRQVVRKPEHVAQIGDQPKQIQSPTSSI